MSLDLKIYVGSVQPGPSPQTLLTYAYIDLCCIDNSQVYTIQRNEFPQVAVIESDGDTLTKEDKYNQPLYAIPIGVFLEELNKDCKASAYRRIHWAKAMLDSIIQSKYGEELVVVMFGS